MKLLACNIKNSLNKAKTPRLLVLLFSSLLLILPLTSAATSYIYGPNGLVASVDDFDTYYFYQTVYQLIGCLISQIFT